MRVMFLSQEIFVYFVISFPANNFDLSYHKYI